MLTIYTLSTCDSCRKATKWLRAQGRPFAERAIRETPPPVTALRAALAAHEGDVRKLFNTSGRDYREQQLGEKLPGLSESEALALLAANGNLIKRPFLVGPGWARAGFSEAAWQTALAKE
jgi:arsenate reductase